MMQMNLFIKHRLTDIENKFAVTRGQLCVGGRDKLGVWD